jgi:hypothetical protein
MASPNAEGDRPRAHEDVFLGHSHHGDPQLGQLLVSAAVALAVGRRGVVHHAVDLDDDRSALDAQVDPPDPVLAAEVDLAIGHDPRLLEDRDGPSLEPGGRRDVVVLPTADYLPHVGDAGAPTLRQFAEHPAQRRKHGGVVADGVLDGALGALEPGASHAGEVEQRARNGGHA